MTTDWQAWVGREQTAQDTLTASLAKRWGATFNRPVPLDGTMPQGIHWALCPPETPTAGLGEDGHPRRDDSAESFLPPIPLPRRMWAAGALAFHAPVAIGQTVARRSRVAQVTEKTGRSGAMVFVELDHTLHADGALAVEERQTLVYRPAAAPDAPLQPAAPHAQSGFDPGGWTVKRRLLPDPTLLFRYSALTFNAHRIHYDLPYARDVERYRGLVVHGPLTASLFLQLAGDHRGEPPTRFHFRGLSPAIAGEPLHLVGRDGDGGLELAAFAGDGRQVSEASAAF